MAAFRIVAGIVSLAVLTACSEPREGLVEARRAVETYPLSAVTFRAMDAFFPTVTVRRGDRTSTLPEGARSLNGDTPVDLGDGAVTLERALRETDTNALLVVKDGEIVYERYLNGSDASSRFIGWSVSKSIVSLLAGVAIDEGYIGGVDDVADTYWPALRDTPFAGVTIRELLRMRAGTSYTEWKRSGTPDVDVLADQSLFRGERRFTDIGALGLERDSEPGERFNYSTLTTCILGRVIEEATGVPLAEYTQEKLWKPAGMQSDGFWLLDGYPPEGRAFAGGGFNAVLRDFARLGLMVLQRGELDGVRVVPAGWVEESVSYAGTEPVLPRTPRGYGYQWWTFLGTNVHEAVGIHGQFISIGPDTNTVIVKTSYWPGRGGGERENLMLFTAIRDAVSAPTND